MLTRGDTAYSIAYVRSLERERPEGERLFDDAYAHDFAAAGKHAEEGTKRFLSLPFFVDGIRLRTRGIDDFVRLGLKEGVRQIVLLGAGFDARALRMPEIEASCAQVFEVDVEGVLASKAEIMEASRVISPRWRHVVASDFSDAAFDQSLMPALEAEGLVASEPVLYVWEGVIAYLGNEAIDRTLRFMANTQVRDTRAVFDFAPMAFEPPAEERVRAAGFSRFEQVSFEALSRMYLSDMPHPASAVPHLGMAYV